MSKNYNYERWLKDVGDASDNRASTEAQIVIFLGSISRSLAIIADAIEAKVYLIAPKRD